VGAFEERPPTRRTRKNTSNNMGLVPDPNKNNNA